MVELREILLDMMPLISSIIIILLAFIFLCVVTSKIIKLIKYLILFPRMKYRFMENNPFEKFTKINRYEISNEITWLLKNHVSTKFKMSYPKISSYDPPDSYGNIADDVVKDVEKGAIGFAIEIIFKIIAITVICLGVAYIIYNYGAI